MNDPNLYIQDYEQSIKACWEGKKFSDLGHGVHPLLSPSTFKAKDTVKIQPLCQIKAITHFILKLDFILNDFCN